MKIKFNSDNDLPLKKRIELDDTIIIVRFVFNDNNKDYPQVSLDKYLNSLAE